MLHSSPTTLAILYPSIDPPMIDIILYVMTIDALAVTILSSVVIFWSTTTNAIPPQPPVRCTTTGASSSCTLSNAYGVWGDRKACHSPSITYPTNESELIESVAYAARNGLKVKVVTKFSHTIPKLSCPTSESNKSILISTAKYDSGMEVDVESGVVTVDSGVGLRDLIDKVERAGLSLVAAPYWEGVSVGGMISTGAHGSSWWGKGGAVHDHVVGISLVVPVKRWHGWDGKIVWLEKGNPLLDAAKVSLGVLGVISKIKLGLEPSFKRSITYNFTGDDKIEEEFIRHANKYEFGDITWYPSRHTAVYRYDNRAPINISGDGINDFIGFQAQSILISKAVRETEKAIEERQSMKGKCTLAATVLASKKLTANGLKNNPLLFTGYPVIGPQSKMQTSGSCLYSSRIDASCAWDPRINGLFFYETTAIFPSSRFAGFVADVKKLRDLNPDAFCNVDVYNGLLIRFIKASDAYLGQPEDSVAVDFNYFRADEATTPRLKEDVLEEVEQMAFFKHGARPHWAKNRNLAFSSAGGVGKMYPRFGRFVEAKKELDPLGMFSTEWSDEVLFGKLAGEDHHHKLKLDGCALEGMCVCSEDRHCSPRKGYFCKHGLVYGDARVCRRYSDTASTF